MILHLSKVGLKKLGLGCTTDKLYYHPQLTNTALSCSVTRDSFCFDLPNKFPMVTIISLVMTINAHTNNRLFQTVKKQEVKLFVDKNSNIL